MKILLDERFKYLETDLETLGVSYTFEPDEEVTDVIGFPDVAIANLDLPKLEVVMLASAGYNGIDTEKLKARNIVLLNGRGIYSAEIAEYSIGYVLAIYKEHRMFLESQKNHVWDRSRERLRSLEHQSVLFLGAGDISLETAKRLKAFGVKTLALNSDGRMIEGFDACDKLENYKTYMREADIVIAALPENEVTQKLLNKTDFEQMKKDSVFINVGRGSLIDYTDLENAIAHLAGFVIDVYEIEPMPEESLLWDLENVYITAHVSSGSQYNEQKTKELFIENVRNRLAGKPLRNNVKL